MLNENQSSLIQVSTQDDQLVVDSRLIAAQLQIQHKNFLATIEKYSARMTANPCLKPVAFETRVVKRSQGGSYEENG